jgi:hypothetical protein
MAEESAVGRIPVCVVKQPDKYILNRLKFQQGQRAGLTDPASTDGHDYIAGHHLGAFLNTDFLDCSGHGCGNTVFHFHGLHRNDRLPAGYRISHFNVHVDDQSGDRGTNDIIA